jgi:predicted  nucleic acid-binding Zn-ribbon protein
MTNPSQIADQIESRLTAADAAIARAEQLQAENTDLKAQLASARQRVTELEADRTRWELERDDARTALVQLQTRVDDIRAACDRAVWPVAVPEPELQRMTEEELMDALRPLTHETARAA